MPDRYQVISEATEIVVAEMPHAAAFAAREACAEAWDAYYDAHGLDADEPTGEIIAYFVLSNEGEGELFDVQYHPPELVD
jgi:hypothetical protein